MHVTVEGLGPVQLGRAHFVASGGEGSVYARDGIAYKIYADRAAAPGADRIRALRPIADPHVVKPERLLTDQGTPIGHTMRFVARHHALCRLFTRSFRDQHALGPDRILTLAEGMRDTIAAVHGAGITIVDLNPMNLLVSPDFRDTVFIDAASWQTPHHPATAVLDAVRDRHATHFDAGTDWFSFAVVVFQLFIGIHPYKGTHPTTKGLDARMQANLSALRPEVRLPSVCFPRDAIPAPWRDWFEAVLDRGLRLPPPSGPTPFAWTPSRPDRSPTAVDLVEIAHFDAPIRRVLEHLGTLCVHAGDVLYVDGRPAGTSPSAGVFGFSPGHRPVFASCVDGRLQLRDLHRRKPIPIDLRADAISASRGQITVRAGDRLLRIVLHDIGDRIVASPEIAAHVLAHATQLFDGVAIQDLLGATWAQILPRPGACFPVHLDELDGKRVIDARFDGGVLVVLAAERGRMDRYLYRFDATFSKRDLQVEADVHLPETDVAVLDTGVAVRPGDGALTVFAADPGTDGVRRVVDPALSGGLRVLRLGRQLGVVSTREVYRVTMR